MNNQQAQRIQAEKDINKLQIQNQSVMPADKSKIKQVDYIKLGYNYKYSFNYYKYIFHNKNHCVFFLSDSKIRSMFFELM